MLDPFLWSDAGVGSVPLGSTEAASAFLSRRVGEGTRGIAANRQHLDVFTLSSLMFVKDVFPPSLVSALAA